MDSNNSYRIRADIGKQNDSAIHVKLTQTYDVFEILSLELTQSNAYKLHQSDYGVVVGRVYANGGFGVPNAKVGIFISADENDSEEMSKLYDYWNTSDKNVDGVRYNLLPDNVDDACHQDVGTFPNKRYVLDNDDVIEVFDKYYKYTTKTNNAGDYMIFGVPKGGHTIHMDVDLSDIGILSQRPRDMIYKGYNPNQFESPNKFKTDKNLSSLVQIMSRDAGIYVYPFWGDTSDDGEEIAITRYDIELPYKFEPTCIFMGSIFSDTASVALGKNCSPLKHQGDMEKLMAGEGSIEMIRKTYDGKIEEFQVKGNRVIDGDGVWCYQIPMNLDYMTTDEFGNMVPTDNPDRGIPTRARVRFRVSMDEAITDDKARNRCRYLIPNNPRDNDDNPVFKETKEVDYEFGTRTREESFRDLFWNNVYTVKNYIPRIQKRRKPKDKRHTGIKMISHHGDNNPMPYNNINIDRSFTFQFICLLAKVYINLIIFINRLIGIIILPICAIAKAFETIGKALKALFLFKWLAKPFFSLADLFYSMVPSCVSIGSEFCGDNVTHAVTVYPGCDVGCVWTKTKNNHYEDQKSLRPEDRTVPTRKTDELYNCIETQLAENYDTLSYDFQNDWINGALYAPMWYRHIVKKRSYLFGLIKRRAKDQWCSSENFYGGLQKIIQPCAVDRKASRKYKRHDGEEVDAYYMTSSAGSDCSDKNQSCHKKMVIEPLDYGLVVPKETILGQTVYYYKPVEYVRGEVKILFAADIVLLGSLNDCDVNGVPQLFRYLGSTTYNLPPNLLTVDSDPVITYVPTGDEGVMVNTVYDQNSKSETSGADWGNTNSDLCGNKEEDQVDGGLFFSIGCFNDRTRPKSCINLSRICELGVGLDTEVSVPDTSNNGNNGTIKYTEIPPDGFISFDEHYDWESRTMFATMNGNNLKTRINTETGFPVYDFRYLNVNAFDNSLEGVMRDRQSAKCSNFKYKKNYELEAFSEGYYDFRMGLENVYYSGSDDTIGASGQQRAFPRYENSFYFYFGLKDGKTAIDKFRSQFFSECGDKQNEEAQYEIKGVPNTWCRDRWDTGDGYVAFDLSKVEAPVDVFMEGTENNVSISFSVEESMAKFYIGAQNDAIEAKGYKRVIAKGEHTNVDGNIPEYDSGNTVHVIDAGELDEDIVSLLNGNYRITMRDGSGEIFSTLYSHIPRKLKYETIPTDFEDDDATLLYEHNNDREEIADFEKGQASVDGDETADTRYIGGTICIRDIVDSDNRHNIDASKNAPINAFYVEITNNDEEVSDIVAYAKVKCGENLENYEIIFEDGVPVSKNLLNIDNSNRTTKLKLIFGVPKGGTTYTVRVRELCGGADNSPYWETNNVVETDTVVGVPHPSKLLIGGVDYSLIRSWNVGTSNDIQVLTPEGCESLSGKIANEGTISQNWFRMSKATYDWQRLAEIWTNYDFLESTNERIAELFEKYDFLNILKRYILTYPNFTNNGSADGTDAQKMENSAWTDGIWNGSYCDFVRYIIDDNVFVDEETEEYNEGTETKYYTTDQEYLEGLIDPEEGPLVLIQQAQADYIDSVKRIFRLNCEGGGTDVDVAMDTTAKGIINEGGEDVVYPRYYYFANNERAREEETWNDVIGFNCGNTEPLTFNDITVPTVTYSGSDLFDGKTSYSGAPGFNIVANLRQSATAIKHPYFVYSINKRKKTIPENKKYFGFHIVDKLFTSRYNVWSSVVQYPICDIASDNTIDVALLNYRINLLGMYAGRIMNGNPFNVNTYTNKVDDRNNTTFNTQTVDLCSVRIKTLYHDMSDEDSMPVERVVSGVTSVSAFNDLAPMGLLPYDEDDIIRVLDGLFVQDDGQVGIKIPLTNVFIPINWCKGTYNVLSMGGEPEPVYPIPITPSETSVSFTDRFSCQLNDRIYGLVTLDVDGESISYTNESDARNGNVLKVSANGFNENDTVYYMFYKVPSPSGYPLYYNPNGGNSKVSPIDGIGFTGLFSINNATANSTPFMYNDNSLHTRTDSVARNTTGEYPSSTGRNNGRPTKGQYYYVVAEAGSFGKYSRAISPLYYFGGMSAIGCATKITRITWNSDDDEQEAVLSSTATLMIRFDKNDDSNIANQTWEEAEAENTKNLPYYLRYYPFTVNVNIQLSYGGDRTISETHTITPKEENGEIVVPYIKIGLTAEETKEYVKPNKRANRIYNIMVESEIYVTDVTGLTTKAEGNYYGGGKKDYSHGPKTATPKFCVSADLKSNSSYNFSQSDDAEIEICAKGGTEISVSWDGDTDMRLKDVYDMATPPQQGWEIYTQDEFGETVVSQEVNAVYFNTVRRYGVATMIIPKETTN